MGAFHNCFDPRHEHDWHRASSFEFAIASIKSRGNLRFAGLTSVLACLLLSACSQAPDSPPSSAENPSSEAATAATSADQSSPGTESAVEPPIRRAARALAQKRLFEPAGDNALELYLQVIEDAAQAENLGENNAEDGRLRRLSDSVGADPRTSAQQTLSDLFPYGMLWVKRAIEEQRFDDAGRVIGLLERTQPGSESLHSLRDALAAAQTQRDAMLASARLSATQSRQSPTAVNTRSMSESAGLSPSAPPAVDVSSASVPARDAVATPSPITSAASTAPAADTLQAAPVTPPTAVSPTIPTAAAAVELVLERQVTPRYPNRARRQRIEGWVEVRFSVQADGSVAQPEVVDAEPRGVFDREAVEAVRRWKYAPPGRNTDTSRRIEFRLNS